MNNLKTMCALAKYALTINEAVNDEFAQIIIKILKSENKTYGELDVALKKLRQHLNYSMANSKHKHWLDYLLNRVEEILQEEKNDLPIANRPKSN